MFGTTSISVLVVALFVWIVKLPKPSSVNGLALMVSACPEVCLLKNTILLLPTNVGLVEGLLLQSLPMILHLSAVPAMTRPLFSPSLHWLLLQLTFRALFI